MKRFRLHVAVDDLTRSVRFCTTLFAAEPSVLKEDYARWMLEDPRVNFAISARGKPARVEHLGIQAESAEELAEVHGRLRAAEGPILEEGQTTCCYARFEKSWIADPSGIAWEAFLTTGEHTSYGEGGLDLRAPGQREGAAACCAPACCSPEA